MVCTPSARLEQTRPGDNSTSYAMEGTLAHALAEALLTALRDSDETLPVDKDACYEWWQLFGKMDDDWHEQLAAYGLDGEEMLYNVYPYVHMVYEAYLTEKAKHPDTSLHIEVRADISEYVPEGYGTADAVVLNHETLHVFDLKYGKGVQVEAEGNAQMMCYAIGAMTTLGPIWPKDVIMHIGQVRLNNCPEWHISPTALMTWADKVLRPQAKMAYEGRGEMVPGKHCKFCKVAGVCPALRDVYLNILNTNPELMDAEAISAAYADIELIKTYITRLEEAALQQFKTGDGIPGYKVVEGRSLSKIKDTTRAMERLASTGLPEDSYSSVQLKSITELKRTLRPAGFEALLGDLVVKGEGKPTVVAVSDKRPAIDISIANEFKNLI